MATSSFYNDNLYRTYPFVAEDHSVIPNQWLVGLRVCVGCGAKFSSFPFVFLTGWQTENGNSLLQFSCELEEIAVLKTLVIPAGTPPMTRVLSGTEDNVQITVITGHCPDEDVTIENIRLRAEPTCILWLQHRGISSVQVGNSARKVLPLPDGIDHEYYGTVSWWKQGEASIVGLPLLFSPGFNCAIQQRTGNRLQIEASRGSGLGEVQEDGVKGSIENSGTIISEMQPMDSLRKDGLPHGGAVLYSFCGAVGPHVRMQATSTIRLTSDPETHTIIIGAGNLGGDVC